MAFKSKNVRKAEAQVERRPYQINEAIDLLRKVSFVKFDETVEVAMRLGVDPKHADQMVRGTVVLPNGTGKKVRVLVFASGEKLKEAEAAGAEFVGGDEMATKILEGWVDFDAVVSTPDMMKAVGRLGRVLGPRGLMPNPKSGTVTFDVTKAITEIKSGKVEFRVDKAGIVHAPLGKLSFGTEKLRENAESFVKAVLRAKPSAAKGKYVQAISLSSTMGPGLKLDEAVVHALEG